MSNGPHGRVITTEDDVNLIVSILEVAVVVRVRSSPQVRETHDANRPPVDDVVDPCFGQENLRAVVCNSTHAKVILEGVRSETLNSVARHSSGREHPQSIFGVVSVQRHSVVWRGTGQNTRAPVPAFTRRGHAREFRRNKLGATPISGRDVRVGVTRGGRGLKCHPDGTDSLSTRPHECERGVVLDDLDGHGPDQAVTGGIKPVAELTEDDGGAALV